MRTGVVFKNLVHKRLRSRGGGDGARCCQKNIINLPAFLEFRAPAEPIFRSNVPISEPNIHVPADFIPAGCDREYALAPSEAPTRQLATLDNSPLMIYSKS